MPLLPQAATFGGRYTDQDRTGPTGFLQKGSSPLLELNSSRAVESLWLGVSMLGLEWECASSEGGYYRC